MPDVFDQLSPEPTRDVFDKIESKGDIFDRISASPIEAKKQETLRGIETTQHLLPSVMGRGMSQLDIIKRFGGSTGKIPPELAAFKENMDDLREILQQEKRVIVNLDQAYRLSQATGRPVDFSKIPAPLSEEPIKPG